MLSATHARAHVALAAADPLGDVQNYRRVSWVMRGGVRVYERALARAMSR